MLKDLLSGEADAAEMVLHSSVQLIQVAFQVSVRASV